MRVQGMKMGALRNEEGAGFDWLQEEALHLQDAEQGQAWRTRAA